MKAKPMELYAFSFRKSYYVRHPLAFVREIKVLAQNAWHRMRYGFAWIDLWNMDTYLGKLVPSMLRELADRACGYPDSEGCPDMETYRAYLREFAKLWDYANSEDDNVPELVENSHSEYALVERMLARARIALMNAPDWKVALMRFVYTELGALAARGWLWD